MNGTQIFLDYMDGQEAAALVVDGRLEDLIVDSEAFAPGTIFRAKVDRPAKGQGGVFVSFPEGRGFLRQIKGVSVGQNMLVQVTGYADEGKAIPLTTKLLFKNCGMLCWNISIMASRRSPMGLFYAQAVQLLISKTY